MRVGALILTLWWLFCGMMLGAAAGHQFRAGQTWVDVLSLLLTAVAFAFFFREARRIDRD